MPDDTDPASDRRVTDDLGTIREWAEEVDAVPVRMGRSEGASGELALLPREVARDYEQLDWPAFGDELDGSETAVTYDDSGDADHLSVVDAESIDEDEVRHDATSRPGYEERNVEGKEYEEHEMRGVGASAAMTDDDSGDEAVRETRPDREESTATALDQNDVGKTVVDEDETELGIVAQASGEDGGVHVDVRPGITERILSKLGWTGEEDVDHVIPQERIVSVSDDRVVLRSDDLETTGE